MFIFDVGKSPLAIMLPPLSPQPLLKLISIQPLRHQFLSSLPPVRSSKIQMLRGILHQILDFPRLWAILPFTDYSRLMSPLRKNARSSLITMSDADLEGVVVESSEQGNSTAFVLLLESLE